MIAQTVSAPALTDEEYPAPELTTELVEGFAVGVQMLYPEHTDEDVKRLISAEWPGAFREPKCLDIVETILGMMKGPVDLPLPLCDVAPGILLGILRANPKKYVERYQLENLIGMSYPVKALSQQIDAAVAELGLGVISVETNGNPLLSRFWRRGRTETV